MYHCRKTSLGSTILGAACARIDCVTYCFKYLAKFVDQVDLDFLFIAKLLRKPEKKNAGGGVGNPLLD